MVASFVAPCGAPWCEQIRYYDVYTLELEVNGRVVFETGDLDSLLKSNLLPQPMTLNY